MKTWIKRSLFGIFGATILIGGMTACGSHHERHGASLTAEQFAQKRDKMVNRAGSYLDLSAEQKQKLAALGDKLYAQRSALIGSTPNPRAELKALVASDKFDAVKAQAFITDKTSTIQAKSPEVIAALADFYNSLNPAQQQKVRDLMERRSGWFQRG